MAFLIGLAANLLAHHSWSQNRDPAFSDLSIYTDTSGRLGIEEISSQAFNPLYHPVDTAQALNARYIHWARIKLAEPPGPYQYLTFPHIYMPYLYLNGIPKEIGYLKHGKSVYAALDPGHPGPYYLKLDNQFGMRYPFNFKPDFRIVDRDQLDHIEQTGFFGEFSRNLFKVRFMAILFFLLVFTLFQWLINRQLIYGQYSAYLLFTLLFYCLRVEYLMAETLKWFGWSREILGRWFALGSVLGYLSFTYSFIGLNRKEHPLLFRLMLTGSGLYLLATLALTILSLVNRIGLGMDIYFTMRNLIVLTGGPFLIYQMIKINTALSRIILTGSLILLVLALLSIANENSLIWRGKNIEFFQVSFTQLGVLLELLIFSAGLGFRSRWIQEEANRTQIQLIGQLKENEHLQSELNKKLQLEKEKLEIEQKLGQAELRLLKAQINPHFLFNSFNAIKDLIRQNKTVEADQYLGRFTKMMRGVLNGSDIPVHILEHELEFSENYVQLEALRFAKPLQLDIHSDKESLELSVPTLILQPLLENAIWHGLLHNKGEKKLEIRTKLAGGQLIIEVVDNGPGLGADTKFNGNPFGIRLVQDRLKIQYPGSTMEIMDRNALGAGEHGALVRMRIPVMRVRAEGTEDTEKI